MIIGGLATMPSRRATAPTAIASILPNVDRLYLYLDQWDEVPSFAIHKKIEVIWQPEAPSIGANGKLLGLLESDAADYYLCFDDDLKYPRYFASVLLAQLKCFKKPTVIGIHGSRLHRLPKLTSYREDRQVFHCSKANMFPKCLDVVATNGCAFRVRDLSFDVRQWSAINRVDLSMALEAETQGVTPMLACKPSRFVHILAEVQADSIYSALLKNDTEQTHLANELLRLRRERSSQAMISRT